MRTVINNNPEASVLAPDDWMNVIWVITRVMGIVGYPPVAVHIEDSGTPGVMWVDPDDPSCMVVLDYDTAATRVPSDKAKMTMHIAEQLSEGVTLALIGLCTMRDVLWDIIPLSTNNDDDDDDENEIVEEMKS